MEKIKEILYVFLFCIPFAIVVYILANIGILIYKLYKMKKYLVFYWRETGDDKDWFEQEVEANSLEEALAKFKDERRLVKIDSIGLITKPTLTIKKEKPKNQIINALLVIFYFILIALILACTL